MPAEKPTKTGIPYIVDMDLVNSLDLHIASNNFISIIDDFSEYIALNYAWKISKQTKDPITSEAKFFKDITDSNHIMDKLASGIQPPDTTSVNYDIIDMNSYLREHEIWIRGTNKLPEKLIDSGSDPTSEPRVFFKALNLKTDIERVVEYVPPLAVKYQTINSFLLVGEQWEKDENGFPQTVTKNGSKYYVSVNTLTNAQRHVSIPAVEYTTLDKSVNSRIEALNAKYNTGFGANEMTDEFLWHWYEKFKTAHYLVREEYKNLVGSDYTENFFEDFNDSIGMLGRLFEYPDTTSVITPDITFDMSRTDGRITVPRTIPPNIFDKLDDDIKFVLLESSKTVNSLFRRNIVHAVEELSNPQESHGSNLMTDHLHYHRMSLHYGDVASIVSDTLGVSYRILAFATSALNKQNTATPKIHQIIEYQQLQTDALKNKIEMLTKDITTQTVLKADYQDLENQG